MPVAYEARNHNANHPVDNIYLTQEMADSNIRYLTQDQRGYLGACSEHGTSRSWVWGNRSTGEKLRQSLIKKGMLKDVASGNSLTPLGVRTCAVLFPQHTAEEQEVRRQERLASERKQWEERRMNLATTIWETAKAEGTDLGFKLPLVLADAIIGSHNSGTTAAVTA